MQRFALSLLALLPLLLAAGPSARAHCEVPCGIYDDPSRFTSMLEDAATITKAMGQITALAGKQDPQSVNQVVRWVTTKEQHATRTMDTIGQYFMAQRIKAPAADDAAARQRYLGLLTGAHRVTVAAMKCKQTVDGANAAALEAAIRSFQGLYEGGSEVRAGGAAPAPQHDHGHGHHHHR